MSTSSEKSTTGFVDYYALLGVAPGADTREIEKAYYSAERKYHPKHYPANKFFEATDAFVPYRDAHDILMNYAKRRQYHRTYFYNFVWRDYESTPVINAIIQTPNLFWLELLQLQNGTANDEVLYPY